MLAAWKNLSVTKKLYAVFGVMGLLIIFELAALSFAMNTLSSVRAFVEGEALWSKAQKNAIHSLHQFVLTEDPQYYQDFLDNLRVPMGDHQARVELEKANPDLKVVTQGFLQGGIHPHDVEGVIQLLTRFEDVSYIQRAVSVWSQGDDLVQELRIAAEELKNAVEEKTSPARLTAALTNLGRLNTELTRLEIEFSKALGEGSRWLEGLLFFILLMAVLTVESTGLLLTFSFSQNLSRSLSELSLAAQRVGRGDFSQKVPVRTKDELGRLAVALNNMTDDLKRNIGWREEAEFASQSKSLFLANVSHELRTPLGVIMGYVELMKDRQLPEEDRQRYLSVIDQTGKNLHRIVNDILDISKVEAGHLDTKIQNFNLQDFINEISQMLQLKAADRQTELHFEPSGLIPDLISTDRHRLRQIFINLITNALKFTEQGKVTVRYWLHAENLHFEVEDTGLGIPLDFQDKLFNRFSRVETSEMHLQQNFSIARQEGAGLGLALSRGIARNLGGDVRLKTSQLGVGSVFHAWVRLESTGIVSPQPPASTLTYDSTKLKGKRILVVDDAPDNQVIVELFLVKEGVEVTTANDGKEGVNVAMNSPVDLILMDMQMPVMNGFDATRELRRQGFQKPIVAFTANAMKGDEKRCMDAGCNAMVTKPIEPEHLLSTLANLV